MQILVPTLACCSWWFSLPVFMKQCISWQPDDLHIQLIYQYHYYTKKLIDMYFKPVTCIITVTITQHSGATTLLCINSIDDNQIIIRQGQQKPIDMLAFITYCITKLLSTQPKCIATIFVFQMIRISMHLILCKYGNT